jgi:hypothetical protein
MKLPKKIKMKGKPRMENRTTIPPGTYLAEIKNAEVRESSTGNNYLAVTYRIIKGDHKGRLVWGNYNLWHDKATPREIAEKEFATLCDAIGVGDDTVTDTKQLVGKRLNLTAKIRPAQGMNSESNAPAGYEPAKGGKKGKKKPW